MVGPKAIEAEWNLGGTSKFAKFEKINFFHKFVKIYKILLSLALSFKDCVVSNA